MERIPGRQREQGETVLYSNRKVTVMGTRTIQDQALIGLFVILFVSGLMAGIGVGYFLMQGRVSALEYENEQFRRQVSELIEEIQILETMFDTLEKGKNECEETQLLKEAQILLLEEVIGQLEAEIESLQMELLKLQSAMNITLVEVSFSRTEDTSSLLQHWIGRANETINVMVMLITQDELADALIEAHERGLDVDVIIDDEWLFSSGSDYQEILDAGIDIRDDNRAGLMHHKVIIIDDYVVVVGSYNWSTSAEDTNDENVLIMKSEVVAQAYLEEFKRIWNQTAPAPGPAEAPEGEEPEEPTGGYVVINEIEQNPDGTDAGHEWVELYNPSDQAVDISGWRISTTHGKTVTIIISEGNVLEPGEYWTYILAAVARQRG